MADRLISADALKKSIITDKLTGWTNAIAAIDLAPTVEAEPYAEFCEWVADTVFYEDFEDKWTLGAFAEVACRKLEKLGFVKKVGDEWARMDGGEND